LSLQQYSAEQLQEMSFIEIAYELLAENKQPISFKEIMDEITKVLNLTEQEVKAKIAQFYTDLNIDGRFMSLGENRWGLRVWYPVDHVEEDVAATVKPKKKKAKKVKDEDEFIEEEEDLGFDDVDEFEDDEDLLDDDDEDTFDDDLDDDDEDEDEDDDDLLDVDDEEIFDDDLEDDDEDLDEDEDVEPEDEEDR
jgi:DNA-directed RNA polymerase subunit delta